MTSVIPPLRSYRVTGFAEPLLPKDVTVLGREFVSASAMCRALLSLVFPALSARIPHVIGLGPEEQVPRIEAGRIVAMVADKESFGDRPDREFIGEFVPSDWTRHADAIHMDVCGAVVGNPALVSYVRLRPKGFQEQGKRRAFLASHSDNITGSVREGGRI